MIFVLIFGVKVEAVGFFPVTDQQQCSQKEKQQINYLVVYGFGDGV